MFTATSVTLGRRACAVLALSSAGLHAAMLGHASNVVAGVLLTAMIVACVYCARDLWMRGVLPSLGGIILFFIRLIKRIFSSAPGRHIFGVVRVCIFINIVLTAFVLRSA